MCPSGASQIRAKPSHPIFPYSALQTWIVPAIASPAGPVAILSQAIGRTPPLDELKDSGRLTLGPPIAEQNMPIEQHN